MKKRTNTPVEVEIDATYESHVNRLGNVAPGHTSDYAIEPARPEPRLAPPKTWVPEVRQTMQREVNLSISPQDAAFLAQAHQAVGQVINAPRREREHSGHTRQVDNSMGIAKSSAWYAMLYIIAFALGLGALLFLIWYVKGGDGSLYFGGYVLLLSGMTYWALERNREKGLHHSSTGIAHHELEVDQHEIDSRERIALGTVDRHIALLEKKLLVELEMKRLEDRRNG